MFSDEKPIIYRYNQLGEVICQLRFPVILTIDSRPPAEFQELIRDAFPQFQSMKELPAPKIVGAPGNFSLDSQPATINYQFTSADGKWRINLTNTFISLSCAQYKDWETFAGKLDKPLAAFIQVYKPAYFERVGLRYLNFISRKALCLEDVAFRELIQPAYLGVLGMDDFQESSALRSSVDAEFAISGGCRVNIHAGPGFIKRPNLDDNELKFIFDQDLYMAGNIPVNYSAGSLQTLHSQAYGIFRSAITDQLHNAMDPTEKE